MLMSDEELRWLVLDMLKRESARDKQSLIGASEIGNPCDYCLGRRLLNMERPPQRYWMGAKIGTAIHAELEDVARLNQVKAETYKFSDLEGALVEQKITLGTIEGYGTLGSKPDLVLPRRRQLIDYKTSTKDKIKKYKLDGVPKQYVYQQNLYAWGLTKMGVPIEKIALIFINRDGLTDADVWVYSFEYDESLALKAWDRLELIWNYLQEHDVETLTSHNECYTCTMIYGRV